MSDPGLVLALVVVGYIVGVWTGAMVFSRPQTAHEDAGGVLSGVDLDQVALKVLEAERVRMDLR
jgi:hypothetical protein